MSKRLITRNRPVKACVKCFNGKRKCNKEKPVCTRCARLGLKCVYLAKLKTGGGGSSFSTDSSELKDSTLHFLNDNKENEGSKNFRIVTNRSGELAIFVPKNLFPFYDPSSVVTYLLKTKTDDNKGMFTFNFSELVTNRMRIGELRSKMPKEVLGNFLISHFLNSIFPLVPIIDQEDFILKWKLFLKNPSSFEDLNAMMTLFAVFFSSSFSLHLNQIYQRRCSVTPISNLKFMNLAFEYFECVENIKVLLMTNYNPTIPAISSLALMYYVSSTNCNELAVQVSSLLRYSQMAGLHKKASRLSGTPLKEVVYAFVVFLDSLVSFYTGLPSQVDQTLNELYDGMEELPSNAFMLAAVARFRAARLCADITTQLSSGEPLSQDDLKGKRRAFKQVERDLHSIDERISNLGTSCPSDLTWSFNESWLFVRRAGRLLAYFSSNTQCKWKKKKSEINLNNRGLILQSLLLINESFLKISSALEQGTDSFWFLRNTYPFEPIIIVLSHLKRYPSAFVNFLDLEEEVYYTRSTTIDYFSGDLRVELIEKCCQALSEIECLWPLKTQNLFKEIFALKSKVINKKAGQET